MKTKKLLGTALALAMILPSFSQANAELLKNLKLSGQLDWQGTSGRNITDFSTRQKPTTAASASGQAGIAAAANNDRIGDMQTRLLLHLDWDLLDDVHAKLTLAKNDRSWGTAGTATPSVQGNSQPLNTAGANILGSIYVDQAYVKIDKVFGSVDTTLGRQYFGNSGDVIIYFGPSDKAEYGLPTNAIDAARFDWNSEKVGVTALAGKTVSKVISAAVAPTADVDVTGAKALLKANDNAALDLYTWNVQTHATGPLGNDPSAGFIAANGKNDNLFITGGKLKLNGGGAWFNGEFAKNWGDNRTGLVTQSSARYKGWMVHTDLGYKADVSGLGALTGWGDFGFGTGQRDFLSNERRGFVAVAGDYRPGAIYGRFAPYTNGVANTVTLSAAGTGNMATNTLSNRVIYGGGVKVTPDAVKKLTVGVAFWDFHTQTLAAVNTPTVNGPQNTAFSGNKHIGSEGDVTVDWKHSDNVWFEVTGARFMPGGIISEANQSTRLGGLQQAGGNSSTVDASARSGRATNPALMAAFDVRVKF